MFRLIYTDSDTEETFRLPEGDTVVGRSPSCDLVLMHSSVSRVHARITVDEGKCYVSDLSSRNGIFCNGEAVTRVLVRDGDQLLIGDVPGRVEYTVEDILTITDQHILVESPYTRYRSVDTEADEIGEVTLDTARQLLQLVSKLSTLLLQARDLQTLVDELAVLIFQHLPAERIFLLLQDFTTGELVPKLVQRRDGQAVQQASISSTVTRKVIAEKTAILALNVEAGGTFGAQSLLAQDVRSFMCAPLWDRGIVNGVLYVDNPRQRQFTDENLELLVALSHYVAIAIDRGRSVERLQQEQRRRERLERYCSPAVVDRILAATDEAATSGFAQEREVSVLFADIVGFTALSEGMRPSAVASLLNEFLEAMSDVVFRHNGTVDKFIGDAIMAVFGAPIEQKDHALHAVRAALEMQQVLHELNARRQGTPIRVRIAINSGVVLAGDVGSLRRREYTVLGDVVNTAARLEESVAGPDEIVISRATYDLVSNDVNALPRGEVALRGRSATLEVYTVDTVNRPEVSVRQT